ncbi:MAG: hypothetical protein K8R54_17490 [Bacteroidales bacterium]|nr:hypothetical protein [Bacteroidales bacterium]
MYKEKQILFDAFNQLKQLTGEQIILVESSATNDSKIKIKNVEFIVEVKNELRASNKGIFFSKLHEIKSASKIPVIVIAKYIAGDVADELRKKAVNYIDIAGNSYISHDELFIFISGQKTKRIAKTNQSRAFQEAGIKLIFHLLRKPENIQFSYRELAETADISVGSVSNVMKELEELNFILKTKTKRILKNMPDLLNRWIIAYNDVLQPRLIKNRMRFAEIDNYYNWDTLPVQDVEDINLWGGEPAAAVLTGQLQPEKFTIYTNGNWQNIAADLKLIPDENGQIEILQMFWNEEDKYRENYITPALLIYADLMGSGDDRNIETAKLILENELQHIK